MCRRSIQLYLCTYMYAKCIDIMCMCVHAYLFYIVRREINGKRFVFYSFEKTNSEGSVARLHCGG